MGEPQQALDEVARQRRAMAARIQLPWWYLVLVAVSLVLLMGGSLPMRDLQRAGIPEFPYVMLGVLIQMPILLLFRRWSGLHLVERSTRYPALKRHIVMTVVIYASGFLVELALYMLADRWSAAPWAAIALGGVWGCLVAAQMYRVNAGIRKNVLDGVVSSD